MSEPERPVVRNQQTPIARKSRKNKLPPNTAPVAYEYKLIPYLQQNVEDLFNQLGELGWKYRGNETGTGKAVFMRVKKDE